MIILQMKKSSTYLVKMNKIYRQDLKSTLPVLWIEKDGYVWGNYNNVDSWEKFKELSIWKKHNIYNIKEIYEILSKKKKIYIAQFKLKIIMVI